MKIRTGFGYDVHAFAEGRALWIGGVQIAYPRGLQGHSDADVLIHALCDALLGAANLGDIGVYFPDTADEYEGISSKILLTKTMEMIRALGYEPGNVDATIVAEEPKLRPYVPIIQQTLAEIMQVDPDDISIKATTTERLGFTGRGEGIAACVNVLITELLP